MATLVLNAVGTAVGGPLGGLVGAVAGRFIDSQVFGIGNRTVEGRREDNLDVQSAAFGQAIPRIYGRGRYAGNVLWSTGLIETREEDRQGSKGGPSVTTVTYSYTASFAVGLCMGPIEGIGRIWADGKLIRGAGQALSVGGDIRIYLGDDDQLPDPLIEGEVGLGSTPAFRGIAYCVFENLPLSEFVNRIPNLSFEVIEREVITTVEIAADLLRAGDIAVDPDLPAGQQVQGYSVSGSQSLRDGLAGIMSLYDLSAVARSNGVVLTRTPDIPALSITEDALAVDAASIDGSDGFSINFDHALDLPVQVELGFRDPATDYQKAVQRAQRSQPGSGDVTARYDTQMIFGASEARRLAVDTLLTAWTQRYAITFKAPRQYSVLEPGDLISVALENEPDRHFAIQSITDSGGTLEFSATSHESHGGLSASSMTATSGEVSYVQEALAPTLSAQLFELPASSQFGADAALFAATTRLTGTFSVAGLYTSQDGGASFDLYAQVPAAAVTGTTLNAMLPVNANLPDRANTLEVQLDRSDMALSSRPPLAILNGANLAKVGDELLQFETATLTDDGTYVLTGLLRGRSGTEGAMSASAAGQPFLLLRSGDFAAQTLSVSDIGTVLPYKVAAASMVVDDQPANTYGVSGRSLRPFSPAHLHAAYDATTGVTTRWINRSRDGFGWPDAVDVPNGEAALNFEITYEGAGQALSRSVSVLSDVATPAELTQTFGAGPYDLTVTVRQMSDVVGLGDPASVTVHIPA